MVHFTKKPQKTKNKTNGLISLRNLGITKSKIIVTLVIIWIIQYNLPHDKEGTIRYITYMIIKFSWNLYMLKQ